ncbi:unnamed protein product [Bemisia tabaci]|uniref:Tetratricopeptide repeat protein 27 n=1 Tax=Bemisia tabaci TaxID=7038 RepID=A0A9P0AAD3_BEMTA|nr:unnamed protein product [Bemisia tabaci]
MDTSFSATKFNAEDFNIIEFCHATRLQSKPEVPSVGESGANDSIPSLTEFLRKGEYFEVFHSNASKNLLNSLQAAIISSEHSDDVDLIFLTACNSESVNRCLNTLTSFSDYLCLPVAFLRLFVQANWTGPPVDSNQINGVTEWVRALFAKWNNDSSDKLRIFLTIDGESICQNAKHLELLVAAQFLFKLNKFYSPFQEWWYLRSIMLQQRILEERSEKLHNILLAATKSLEPQIKDLSPVAHRMFILELCQYYLNLYAEIGVAKTYLQTVENDFNMNVQLRGALGKRTKFQENDVAQLFLQITTKDEETSPNLFENEDVTSRHLPKDINLNDDVRLDEINFLDDSVKRFPKLSPLQQAVLLCHFNYMKKSQPKDDLENEELSPYLFSVLAQPQCWGLQTVALIYRSQLERGQPKALERSLTQLESLVSNVSSCEPNVSERLDMFFYIYLPQAWEVEAILAELFITIGAVQSALDIYLRIEFWEQIVACYNHLNLRHKAAEVIQNELKKKETPKLYCLLGDATDDPDCYQKAWDLSNHKSARAQRHWGMYHYNRKQYQECIPFFEKSLSLNSLQPELIYRLGYAALTCEKWELCASTYRRYCVLQPDCFEAWNNLAKAYVKRGEKHRALNALQEAIKCNYENWRVWDNLLAVSTDCADFETVLLSYHRLLDLRGRHTDVEVLECVVKAITQNLSDADGKPCKVHLKAALKLFGRLTSQIHNNAKLWQLYAELTACSPEPSQETFDKVSQYFQRAHKAAIQDFNWFKNVSTCKEVLSVCVSLARSYKDCCNKCTEPRYLRNILSSAKLSINSVLSKIKQEHTDLISGKIVEELSADFNDLQQELNYFENELNNIKNQLNSS